MLLRSGILYQRLKLMLDKRLDEPANFGYEFIEKILCSGNLQHNLKLMLDKRLDEPANLGYKLIEKMFLM